MKFDPRVSRLVVRPPRPTVWSPASARRVRATEAIVMACLALYFAAGVVGLFV